MNQAIGRKWTYAEYVRLPGDGNHYEILDGELLVTLAPSPIHQHVAGTLYMALRAYAERERAGLVLLGVDLLLEPGQYLCPGMVHRA